MGSQLKNAGSVLEEDVCGVGRQCYPHYLETKSPLRKSLHGQGCREYGVQ